MDLSPQAQNRLRAERVTAPREQLEMVWPARGAAPAIPVLAPAAGYVLRSYAETDGPAHIALMRAAGFETWGEANLARVVAIALPEGIWFAVHSGSGEPVATAMASHNPIERHPSGAELGWVAAHPEHRGRGLGRLVCAAAMACFVQAGYRRLFLRTDDFRLAAIKTYLGLGWVPALFTPAMVSRWEAVCGQLGLRLAELPAAGEDGDGEACGAAAAPGAADAEVPCGKGCAAFRRQAHSTGLLQMEGGTNV